MRIFFAPSLEYGSSIFVEPRIRSAPFFLKFWIHIFCFERSNVRPDPFYYFPPKVGSGSSMFVEPWIWICSFFKSFGSIFLKDQMCDRIRIIISHKGWIRFLNFCWATDPNLLLFLKFQIYIFVLIRIIFFYHRSDPDPYFFRCASLVTEKKWIGRYPRKTPWYLYFMW